MRRNTRAFTLAELLVVVAIIALLLALLVPALGKARGVARLALCMKNMTEIHKGWHLFAYDHQNRGPGRADNIHIPSSPYAWSDIINQEVFGAKRTHVVSTLKPIQRFNSSGDGTVGLATQSVGCPEIANFSTAFWERPYIANANLVGGPNWVPGQGDPIWPAHGGIGKYGKSAPIPDGYQSTFYTLGTRLTLIRQPSQLYMSIESRRGHDEEIYRSTVDPSAATPESPISVGGPARTFAFRHPGLRSNYLVADGHVITLSHDDPTVNVPYRFNIE